MATGRITKRSVDALTPRTGDTFLWDDELRGFGVKVTPTGRKGYIYQYRMGVADLTAASAAMGELMDMGFIEMTAEGVFSSSADKPSKARCWRLTWADAPEQSPTHAYREAVVRGARPARRAKQGRLALDRHASEKNRGAKTNTVTPITVSDYNTDAGNYRPDDGPTVLESNTPKQQKRPITVDTHRSAIRHTSSVATTGAPAEPAATPQSKLQNAGGPI